MAKLEHAQDIWGHRADYQVEAAYQEALDALVALGNYEDAPSLADEASKYFYSEACSYLTPGAWHAYDSDTYEKVASLLNRILDYRDVPDWLSLNEALHLSVPYTLT